jgi:hypothetical protein
VRQTYKTGRTTTDQVVIETAKTIILDVNELDPVSLCTIGVATTQANKLSVVNMTFEMDKYKREIKNLNIG